MLAPYLSNLLTGLVNISLNYAATFYIPPTKLLKDPLETLATAIPILLVGHIVLLVFSLLVIKRCSLRQTLVSSISCFFFFLGGRLENSYILSFFYAAGIIRIRVAIYTYQLSCSAWIYCPVWCILVGVSKERGLRNTACSDPRRMMTFNLFFYYSKFNHTLAFAVYLAILTVMPCFTVLAPAEPAIWSKVFLQHR